MNCHPDCSQTMHSDECPNNPMNMDFAKVIEDAKAEARMSKMIDFDNIAEISTNLPPKELERVLRAVQEKRVEFDASKTSVVNESAVAEFTLDGKRYRIGEMLESVNHLTILYEDKEPPEVVEYKATVFRTKLEGLINANCMENGSDTPDFVLAQFLADSLTAFDRATQARETWYARGMLGTGEKK